MTYKCVRPCGMETNVLFFLRTLLVKGCSKEAEIIILRYMINTNQMLHWCETAVVAITWNDYVPRVPKWPLVPFWTTIRDGFMVKWTDKDYRWRQKACFLNFSPVALTRRMLSSCSSGDSIVINRDVRSKYPRMEPHVWLDGRWRKW